MLMIKLDEKRNVVYQESCYQSSNQSINNEMGKTLEMNQDDHDLGIEVSRDL